MPRLTGRPVAGGRRGDPRRRRLDGRQPGDRGGLRRPGRPLPLCPSAQRGPERGTQHGRRPQHSRCSVPRVRGQRRRRRPRRVRTDGGVPGVDRFGPGDGQCVAADRAGAAAGVAVPLADRRPPPHPHHPRRPAAGRPGRLEQGVPAFVLGPARVRLPGGQALRGHARDDPGTPPRRIGGRAERARLLLAGARGFDHPAAYGRAGRTGPDRGLRAGQRVPGGP